MQAQCPQDQGGTFYNVQEEFYYYPEQKFKFQASNGVLQSKIRKSQKHTNMHFTIQVKD